MAQTKRQYRCAECGYQTPKWLGRCPQCGAWDRFGEVGVSGCSTRGVGVLPVRRRLSDLIEGDEARLATGLGEFDRVVGGGLVPGAVVLVGGEPGVGKSTLLLQAAAALALAGRSAVYVTAEESPGQMARRAERLGLLEAPLELVAESDIEAVETLLDEVRPEVLVVDSMQTLRAGSVGSGAGSVTQVREVAGRLAGAARNTGAAVLLVGHVTKEGQLAGPKATEHLVDAVLLFEGDPQRSLKILRATKNRFGSTNEVGLFEMTERGLQEVHEPAAWLTHQRAEPVTGTCCACLLEGTRPLLVEVEALSAPSPFAAPRRVSDGIDLSRLHLVLAVLEQRCGIRLGQSDVYVNVPGGLRVLEPAADLPLALAIASSVGGVPFPSGWAAFGEVGLTGELRPVGGSARRLDEVARQGITKCICPPDPKAPPRACQRPAATLREALAAMPSAPRVERV